MSTLEGKKKKNWGTIRALPPTTSTSFMDLDLCTRDGDKLLINNGVAFTHKVSFSVLIW